MSKINLPNQKKLYQKLNNRLARYVGMVQAIYDSLNLEASKIAVDTEHTDGEFHFSDYPETKKRVDDLQSEFVNNISSVIFQGTSREWKESNLMQDLLADKVYKRYLRERDGEKQEVYYQTNNDALKAFQQRKDRGLNLSQKLWKQSGLYKEELETAISTAIERGTDAITLSKKISQYLNDFPSLQKDYTEKFGHASKANDCEYRSIRLARSEINMAYRKAEQLRWQQMDFVVGYEIHMSGAHPREDVCNRLAGKYPKDFEWTGWHPSCYDDITKVLTNEGWKLFCDVRGDEKILSLNPDTKEIGWVDIVDKQEYEKSGDMVHFVNESLDILVTPEHSIVYLNDKGEIERCSANDYNYKKGSIMNMETSFTGFLVKEYVQYNGFVYDLSLDRNHIMYVSRNGKCFWGSNCMCYKTSILKDEDEFFDLDNETSRNEVTDVPDAFKEWVNENEDRIKAAEKHNTLPYFLKDNKEYLDEIRKEHKEAVKERNSKPSLSMSGSTSNDDIKKGSNVESPNLPTATKQEIEEEAKANYSFAQRDFFDDFTRVTGIERGLSMPVELADRLNANPEFDPQIPEYSRNCASTVVAYVMREFGFDVKASGCSNKLVNAVRYNDVPWYSIWMNGANRPMELKDVSTIKNWAKEKGVTDITPDMYLDFFDEKCKDIGTYIACVPWKVKIDPVTGEKFYNGHYAIIKRLEDGMKYIDPQRDNQRGSAYSYMSLYWLCHSMETRLNVIEKFAGVMKVSDKLLDWNFYDIVQGK